MNMLICNRQSIFTFIANRNVAGNNVDGVRSEWKMKRKI